MEATKEPLELIKTWAPIHRTDEEHLKSLQQLIDEEEATPIKYDSEDHPDYGYNFPGVTALALDCLQTICQFHAQRGQRPFVLDLGAGEGFMSWKMHVAGAHVVAVEGQKASVQGLRQRLVRNVKPFLLDGETITTTSKSYDRNFLDFNIKPYKQVYYITWSSNICHLMKPTNLMPYLINLFRITEPGGYAFATANAPCGNKEICEFYEHQRRQGEKFPGYMLVNRMYKRSVSMGKGMQFTQKYEGMEHIGPIVKAPEGSEPNSEKPGYHHEPMVTTSDYHFYQRLSPSKEIDIKKAQVVFHRFGLEEFKGYFEEVGFIVEEAYYLNNTIKVKRTGLKISDLADDMYNVCIKARKPEKVEEAGATKQ